VIPQLTQSRAIIEKVAEKPNLINIKSLLVLPIRGILCLGPIKRDISLGKNRE
jgi:hypothetical protein